MLGRVLRAYPAKVKIYLNGLSSETTAEYFRRLKRAKATYDWQSEEVSEDKWALYKNDLYIKLDTDCIFVGPKAVLFPPVAKIGQVTEQSSNNIHLDTTDATIIAHAVWLQQARVMTPSPVFTFNADEAVAQQMARVEGVIIEPNGPGGWKIL